MKQYKRAVDEIQKAGVLLVFSIKGREDPPSLWSRLYPRSRMRWDWDETGDDRVVNLWHLMKELSTSKEVVYSKWHQNRATFFSRECFAALLCYLTKNFNLESGLLPEAQQILEELEQDSPLSTKEIKNLTELKGRFNESLYNKSMKQLFQRGLIIGFGEKDDGAFPSAMMGATQLIFEDLWTQAQQMDAKIAEKLLSNYFSSSIAFQKQLKSIEKSFQTGLKTATTLF